MKTPEQRIYDVLMYKDCPQMPLVEFGFWGETIAKWIAEGHVEAALQGEPRAVARQAGFEVCWDDFGGGFNTSLMPAFERKVVKELPDGARHVCNHEGVVLLEKDGAGSIPAEISHLLNDREGWEEHYKWRLQWSDARLNVDAIMARRAAAADNPLFTLYAGSLVGRLRDIIGVENLAYLPLDDEELFDEMLDAFTDLLFTGFTKLKEAGLRLGAAHFWEDICYKNGPLVNPKMFAEKIGPRYKKLTTLYREMGAEIISLDCDGLIDALIPTWLENGVNTMFPIEVGTWAASIAPWRAKYGKELRGIGGMDKRVFAADKAAVDREIERLRPLIDLGGYVPCPDHRIAPDAKWELVQYYCERFRQVFWAR